jgi:hypothetical protein
MGQQEIDSKAQSLERTIQTGDTAALQNQLISIASQDDFNQVVDTLKQMTDKHRSEGCSLPDLQIHKDGLFGALGNVDQIVIKDSQGKKQEVFETTQHRAQELREDPNSLGRAVEKWDAQNWVAAMDAKDTDSSQPIEPARTFNANKPIIRNFVENDPNRVRIQDLPADWQRQIQQQLPRE